MFNHQQNHRVFATGLASALLLLLLSACTITETVQPTTGVAIETSVSQATALPAQVVTPAQNAQTTALAPQDAQATRDAALDNSGKTGPTLPAGDIPPQSGQPEASPTPTTLSIPASGGGAVPPNYAQSTPGGSPATLSPDELATREAALENSGKTEHPSPASKCLGGVSLLLPLTAIFIHKRLAAH